MSDVCANPDCGHGPHWHRSGDCRATNWGKACRCRAFVADVNRPDDECINCGGSNHTPPFECDHAAVPDREVGPLDASGSDEHVDVQHALGATEQLAAILAAHIVVWNEAQYADQCACGFAPRSHKAHRSHLAAVIVAAGWERKA